jgi:hypothetical protein
MYHILATKCHGQDSAPLWEYHPPRETGALASADAPGLVHAPAPIFARIERMEQQVDFAGTRSIFDLVRTVDEVAGARFHPKPVERRLAQRMLGPLAKVRGYADGAGLERPLQRRLELARLDGLIDRIAANADPRATTRSAGAHVGRDFAIRPQREPDQLIARAFATGEDAGPFGTRVVGLIVRA